MPLPLLLVMLSAAAPGPTCDDVPSCVAVSSGWRIDLDTLLRTLPVAKLLEGWSYEHPDDGKRAWVHRSVVEALSTTSAAPRTEVEARALLGLLFAHPAEFAVHGGAPILKALSKGEWRSLLDGCAGFEGLARQCALWAAREGSQAPKVIDTVWALYLADELDGHRGLEAFCALPPVVARFHSRMEELARSHAQLRPVDARLLVMLDEAWSQRLLENRVKHRSPDMAREAVQALVDDRFDVSPRLRRAALWRAAKEPAFARQRQAATAIAGLSSFTQEEQRALIEVARSSDEFRDRAAAALVSLAHRDADARKLTLAALLARPESEERESRATRLVGATSPRNSAPAWSAAVREPRTVCWLIDPLREWMRSCDLADAFDADTLNQVAVWVRAHWRRHDLDEVRVDPSSLRKKQRVRTLVLDDGSELHLRLGPVPDERAGMQPEERERTVAARRALYERLVSILVQPPRHGRGARCGAAPAGPRDHSTLPTRASSSPPMLELRSMDRSVLPPMEVRDAGGQVVAWASGVEHPARRAYRNSHLIRMMRWPGAPVLVHGWWRGAGRYELAVVGEARLGTTAFDVTTDTALVRVAVEISDGTRSQVLPYRRGRPEVTVRVAPGATGLEVTITNGTRDSLLPEADTWRSAMQLDYERRGWTSAMPGSISESPDPMLGPGQSHTFVLASSPNLLPPARWRLSLRYEVDGLEGQRFVTSPVIFDSPPGNAQFGPEESRALVAVASGVLGLRGQTVVHHDGKILPKVRVDAGTHLAGLVRDDSRALVAAFGKALFVSIDGGSNFDRMSLPEDTPIVAGAFSERELVVVTADRKVIRRVSGKWREEGLAPGPARRLAFAEARRGWMVLEDNSLQATVDGGRRWKALPALEGVVQAVAFDGSTLWAAGSAGVARLKEATWNFVHRGPCLDVAAAHDTLVAACEVPLLAGRDSALSPAPLSPDEQRGWVAVDVTADGSAVLAGVEGLARISAESVQVSGEGHGFRRVWLPYLSLE